MDKKTNLDEFDSNTHTVIVSIMINLEKVNIAGTDSEAISLEPLIQEGRKLLEECNRSIAAFTRFTVNHIAKQTSQVIQIDNASNKIRLSIALQSDSEFFNTEKVNSFKSALTKMMKSAQIATQWANKKNKDKIKPSFEIAPDKVEADEIIYDESHNRIIINNNEAKLLIENLARHAEKNNKQAISYIIDDEQIEFNNTNVASFSGKITTIVPESEFQIYARIKSIGFFDPMYIEIVHTGMPLAFKIPAKLKYSEAASEQSIARHAVYSECKKNKVLTIRTIKRDNGDYDYFVEKIENFTGSRDQLFKKQMNL